jgi:hypothetical protein
LLAKNSPDTYCSQRSRAAQEPVFATASRVDVWLVLQHNAPWAAEALPGSRLPAPIKRHLARLARTLPHTKVLLIKQEPRVLQPIMFYVAVTGEVASRLYRFALDSYDDLLTLDIPALLTGAPAAEAAPSAEPLFLACTHGTHDRCCAKFGLPIYRELARAVGPAAWQCSHVGGDRFAANIVCLPHGLYYGRVSSADVGPIVAAARAGQIYPDNYRGRACYNFVLQAAEYFLRRATDRYELPGFRRVDARRTGEQRWLIRFATLPTGPTYGVALAREPFATPEYLSCHAQTPSEIDHYRLLDLAVEP